MGCFILSSPRYFATSIRSPEVLAKEIPIRKVDNRKLPCPASSLTVIKLIAPKCWDSGIDAIKSCHLLVVLQSRYCNELISCHSNALCLHIPICQPPFHHLCFVDDLVQGSAQLPIRHNQIGAEHGSSDVESIILTYFNPAPTNVVPTFLFNEDGYTAILYHGTRFKESKGYIINTFAELEPHATNSMVNSPPPVYTVGPLIDLKVKEKPGEVGSKWEEIMTWLNDQLPSSVVFLCFGSRGSLDIPQLEQIAVALESSGKRFIWSIRRPPPKGSFEMPTEYQNVQEALPEGFLERMEKRGMVCGWTSQVEVLSIGGFVSHCGWNSTLESQWCDVPIATWPLYTEQQINDFELVQELGLAVDLKYDYNLDTGEVVMADVIERAINSLMDNENRVRNRLKEMSEKSRKAVVDGGSSYASLGQLVEDFLGNIDAIDD